MANPKPCPSTNIMQQERIGDAGKAQPKGLSITTQDAALLSKKQKEFNKLIQKLERLNAEKERLVAQLDYGINYYLANIHPLEQRIVELRNTCAKGFFALYGDAKNFSGSNKKVLRSVIENCIDEILTLSDTEPDDEIKAIMEAIIGVSFEQMKKADMEMMKAEMEMMFDVMGIDVDLEELNGNLTQEDLMRKTKEIEEQFLAKKAEQEAQQSARKKTKKQLEREEKEKLMEDARKKNIGTIYKQLAKALHPDREADPLLRLQKEELMKALTVAYEKNDLHTLLKLEMEWLKKEDGDIETLTDDKLGIYNEVLKEQVWALQMEIEEAKGNPRYEPLHRYADNPARITQARLRDEVGQCRLVIDQLEYDAKSLMGKDALKFTKELIKLLKQ